MGKTIIVVDTQYDFMDPNGSLYIGKEAEGLADKISRYIDKETFSAMRNEHSEPRIIHTLDWHSYDDAEFNRFPKHCIKHTIGSTSVLKPQALKQINDFEYKTGFGKYIHVPRSDRYEIVGVCTHLCVAHIAIFMYNSLKNTFPTRTPNIIIYKDLVGDFDPVAAEQMLTRLKEDCGVQIETYFKENK